MAVSLGYYFCGLITDEVPFEATVTQFSTWKFGESPFEPLKLFPWTWEEFCTGWENFWPCFFSGDNFIEYLLFLIEALQWFFKWFLLITLPLIMVAYGVISKYTDTINNDLGKESKCLQGFKKFQFTKLYPFFGALKAFYKFLLDTRIWLYIWAVIWVLYFNLFSIAVSFVAFYLYFIVSYDFVGIYTQVLKLLDDLTPVVRFLPGVVWLVLAIVVLEYFCRKRAKERLYSLEEKNEKFVSKRGVFTLAYGNMGVGKTRFITSMAVTCEAWMRKQALQILLDNDLKFPNFPWLKLQKYIRESMEEHVIFDVRSCKKAIAKMRSMDLYLQKDCNKKWWSRQCRKRGLSKNKYIFDYDREHYTEIYNNGVTIKTVWEAVEAYAQAFLIYAVYTSLIYSNYSVRSDVCVTDYGNMPDYNYDYFERDPLLKGEYSKFCHILDYDMLRMGRKMWDENPNKEAFGFGIYVMSEIDKELKNTPELSGVERNDEECNQKNDLTIPQIKMSRHAVVIDFREFVKMFGDLQRPEDLRGSARQVGELVFIAEKSDKIPVLPFYSPFWLIEGIFIKIVDKFLDFYYKYIVKRADGTLFLYLLKNTSAALHKYCDSVNAKYGVITLSLELESGRMEGGTTPDKWYITSKDEDRYSTNCLSAMFDSDTNEVGIMDVKEYGGIMATEDELDMQHSHFHRERKAAKTMYASDGLDEKLSSIDCKLIDAYRLMGSSSAKTSRKSSDDD